MWQLAGAGNRWFGGQLFVSANNVTSGTVNLLAFFNHLVAKGWIPSTSTLGAIDYGVDLVSTSAMDATFAVTGFSLTTN